MAYRTRRALAERYAAALPRNADEPMQIDFVVIVAIVAVASAARAWQIVFAYRDGARRLRERRRIRAENELFERLERCMQSDRVE